VQKKIQKMMQGEYQTLLAERSMGDNEIGWLANIIVTLLDK
jgi:hypothetical protein